MKLTVLGGSAAGGNTGQGCAGFLVTTNGGANIVLDLGPGTLQELRKHTDFRSLDGVVISHLHVDHILDLAALRYALAYNPRQPTKRVPLWMPPGGMAMLRRLGTAFLDEDGDADFFGSVFDVQGYDPTASVTIADAGICFAPTVHYLPCWAMRVHSEGSGDLFYSADTGPAADLGAIANGCEVALVEAALVEPNAEPRETRGHLTAKEAATLAQTAGASKMILTHMWEEHCFDAYRSAAASAFTGELHLAAPGLTVAW